MGEIVAFAEYAPGGRAQVAGEDTNERTFAGAIRTENADEFARAQCERHTVQYRAAPIAGADILGSQDGAHGFG